MGGKKILMLTGEFSEEYETFVFQQAMEAVDLNRPGFPGGSFL